MRNDRSTAGPGPSEKPAEEEKSDLVALGCVWASVFPALPAAGPLSHPGWDPEGELLLLRLHVASSVRVLILIQPPPGSRGPWNIYDRCIHSRFFIKCEWIAWELNMNCPLRMPKTLPCVMGSDVGVYNIKVSLQPVIIISHMATNNIKRNHDTWLQKSVNSCLCSLEWPHPHAEWLWYSLLWNSALTAEGLLSVY